MGAKKLIFIVLFLGLAVFEGYLLINWVSGNNKEKKETQNFCTSGCQYNNTNYLWEFSKENNITKGFTTEEECMSYCSKYREGFIGFLKRGGSEFVGALTGFFSRR